MRLGLVTVAAVMALTGCQMKEEDTATPVVGAKVPPGARARFVAVGLYRPDALWTHIVAPAQARESPPPDPRLPVPDDDSQIVVVLDSATGEVRQCGNLSGRCVAMNPWSQTVPPTALLKHAADLRSEDARAAAEGEGRR